MEISDCEKRGAVIEYLQNLEPIRFARGLGCALVNKKRRELSNGSHCISYYARDYILCR